MWKWNRKIRRMPEPQTVRQLAPRHRQALVQLLQETPRPTTDVPLEFLEYEYDGCPGSDVAWYELNIPPGINKSHLDQLEGECHLVFLAKTHGRYNRVTGVRCLVRADVLEVIRAGMPETGGVRFEETHAEHCERLGAVRGGGWVGLTSPRYVKMLRRALVARLRDPGITTETLRTKAGDSNMTWEVADMSVEELCAELEVYVDTSDGILVRPIP